MGVSSIRMRNDTGHLTPTLRRAMAFAIAAVALLALAAPAQARAPEDFFGLIAVGSKASDVEGMATLGAGTYRVEISWRGVERTPNGGYNWNSPDLRYKQAAEAGLRPVPIVFGMPEWLGNRGKNVRPPVKTGRQRRAWKDFTAALVRRYGPGGNFWRAHDELDRRLARRDLIVWNEQNAKPYWGPKPKPAQYARLLKMTRQGVDRTQPKTKLIVGGMYGFPNKPGIKAETFLRKLYKKRKSKKLIDGVALHPYSGRFKGVKKQVRGARRVINKAGDRSARIYIGETGWASGGPRGNKLVKTKRKQKQLLNRTFRLFLKKRRGWRIESVFWFTYRDYTEDPNCLWCPEAGLVDQDGKRKPAGRAFRRLVNRQTG